MKTWITLIFLTTVMGWSTANAEYNPDSYLYVKGGFGTNVGDETWITDDNVGTTLGFGYVRQLSEDWGLYGSIRYQYFNSSWKTITHAKGDSYLAHWGLNLEWRHDVNQVTADSYFYANLFYGPNTGENWEDSDTDGSGFGLGYVQRVNKKFPLFGTIYWEHYSHLMAGEPFAADKEESHLDHVGLALQLRF
jgi:hypothetical protein